MSLHGVGKVFGDQPVLEDVNLDLRAGSVTVLIGPSGAGKSTLLRLINHLERADGGYVTVGGQLIGYRREGDTCTSCPSARSDAAVRKWAWCSRASTCSRT